jgi:hypothetical protein
MQMWTVYRTAPPVEMSSVRNGEFIEGDFRNGASMKKKKTVVIWDSCGIETLKFFVVNRDVSRLDGKYVNSSDISDEEQQEVLNLVYDENGKQAVPMLNQFPVDAVRDGATVIVCGFLP